MEHFISADPVETSACSCLVLGTFENGELTPTAKKIDQSTRGLLSRFLKRDEFKGNPGDTLLLNHIPDSPIERILVTGLGKKKQLDGKAYRKALAAAIKTLREIRVKEAICALGEVSVIDRDLEWKARQIVEVFEDGIYTFTQTKTESDNERPSLSRLGIAIAEETERESIQTGMSTGRAISQGVALAKDLGNLPGNICTPAYLAEQAEQIGQLSDKLSITIIDEAEMERLGMGALLSVSRGSREPAKLIVMDYRGGGDAKPHVLVGKGLTFDAGGISLKSAPGMDEMKYDMCGGASVLGTIAAVARLNLDINVVGLVPASENLPDGAANKPGDIVTSMDGKTIEILNTDAEGRLLLCDALTYARRFKPDTVIDIATLTGACVVALGKHPSGLFSNDEALCTALLEAGTVSDDRVWRMPLWDDFQEQLKSNFADMANVGGREGGAITAACFLARFTEGMKWAHLDIAGTAWLTGPAKGATGRPVPLLTQYLIDKAK